MVQLHVEVKSSYPEAMDRASTAAQEMSVGELAERSGVTGSTIRYWESRGLLESRRTLGNQRRFDLSALTRARFIRWSQRVGMALDEVHGVLDLLPPGAPVTDEVRQRASSCWRRSLDNELKQLRDRYEALDQHRRLDPSPRIIGSELASVRSSNGTRPLHGLRRSDAH